MVFISSSDRNDLEEIEEVHNKYRLWMLLSVIFSILALNLRLISIIIPTLNPDYTTESATAFET